MKNDYFKVGVIASAHGIKGEVNVFPMTDDPSRFERLEFVYIDGGKKKLTIDTVKYFKNTVIIKFNEIPDRNAAETYRSREIFVDREHTEPLKEGEYFIEDLIGAAVITDKGENLGTLTDVLKTGANDVFEIKLTNGKTALFPNISECVLKIDDEKPEVTVHVMPGLLD